MEVNAKAEILKIKDGESWIWTESDYGKAEIWLKNGMFFLFEIPIYGGEPRFHNNYSPSRADDLVQTVLSWC